jgi:esterase
MEGVMSQINVREVTAGGEAPERWLAVLHGIFGAGRNWASVARALVRERPEWGALLVDLREHGDSTGFPPPHTLERTAADLDGLERAGGIRAVLGHSFGGKIALLRGRDDPTVQQVWVIDSTPDGRDPEGGAWAMLATLRDVPARFPDRESAAAALVERGVAPPTATWMTTNLAWDDDAYGWRLDFDTMEAMLRDFFRVDLWREVEDPRPGLTVHFVRATGSSVLSAEAVARIRAAGERTGRLFLHEVQGGHWLNADNPAALVDLLARQL